jgi:hypothetical protein
VPSLSVLPSANRQAAALQVGVNAALGAALSGAAPPANTAVAGLEQIVVAASQTLKMYVAASDTFLLMTSCPSFIVLWNTSPFR